CFTNRITFDEFAELANKHGVQVASVEYQLTRKDDRYVVVRRVSVRVEDPDRFGAFLDKAQFKNSLSGVRMERSTTLTLRPEGATSRRASRPCPPRTGHRRAGRSPARAAAIFRAARPAVVVCCLPGTSANGPHGDSH